MFCNAKTIPDNLFWNLNISSFEKVQKIAKAIFSNLCTFIFQISSYIFKIINCKNQFFFQVQNYLSLAGIALPQILFMRFARTH